MRSSTVAGLVVVFLYANLAGAAPSGSDPLARLWERFREGSPPEPGYVDSLDDGLRETLWSAARSHSSITDAVAEVAKRFEIDRDTAADLVEATLVERTLPERYSKTKPDPSQVDRAISALWRAYQRQPDAAIVLQQAGWILFSSSDDPAQERRVLEELEHSTDPAPLAARIAWIGLCSVHTRRAAIGIALGSRPANPVLLLAAAALDEDDPCVSAAWARDALEAAAASGVDDPTFLATTRNRLLAALLGAGIQREAMDVFSSIPAREVDAALPTDSARIDGRLMGLGYEVQVLPVRSALAAAAFLIDERDLARRLAAHSVEPPPSDRSTHEIEAETLELIRSAINRLSGESSTDAFDTLDRAVVVNDSWEGRRFASTSLLFERLARESGYPEIAANLAVGDRAMRETPLTAPERFRTEIAACRARTAELDDEVAGRIRPDNAPTADVDPAAAIVAKSLATPPLHVYTERPLPENLTAWNPSESERERLEKSLEKRKPPGLWPVRVEQSGRSVIAIGLSQDYDPAGETSGGGYWIVRSSDGGKTWGRALYTGLRPMQPYVICSSSRLPLAAGDRLHIEVMIRELDTSKITFPPLRRSFKREQAGLFLDVSWADLEKDSDGDGLTDLAEERLMTDPSDADTDGDGLPDGADPLPQIALTRGSSVQGGVLAEVLRAAVDKSLKPILVGDPGGQGPASPDLDEMLGSSHRRAVALTSETTLFLVADRRPFAGLSLERRIIVLTPSEAATARERFGVHYPGRLRLYVDHAGTRALAIWDESWRGLTIRMTKEGGVWRSTVVGSWIT